MDEILTDSQKQQLTQVPHMKRWNEFKDHQYHQKLWMRFWTKLYRGRPHDIVLDFGCGPCWGWFVANALGCADVINLDIDNDEVRTSFKHYTDILGATVEYWDGRVMPFEDNRFHAVVAKASIMKLVGTEFESLVNELCRVTRPNGTWYIAAVYMCRDFVDQLNETGLISEVNAKNISIRSWTWLPMERQKLFARKLLKPVRDLVRG